MKPDHMRTLSAEELENNLEQWEEQLFRYRCEKKIGQLENSNLLRSTRRDIARAKTITCERKHAASES